MLRGTRRTVLLLAAFCLLLVISLIPSLLGTRPLEEDAGRRPPPPTGFVRSAGGGPPPPGTRLRALGPGAPREIRLAPDGSFRLDPLPEGVTEFEASFGPLRARAEAGRSPVVLELPGVFTLAGRVVDGETREAVADAEVACQGRVARTDERGRFRLEGLPAPERERITVEVRARGYRDLRILRGRDAPFDDVFLKLFRR